MDGLSVAIIGVGDLRFGPPVLAALATYFGERPIEVVLYDEHPEILDAMHRLARSFFKVSDARHAIVSTTDLDEACQIANVFVVCSETSFPALHEEIVTLPIGDWPPPITSRDREMLPLQILRWIRLEDWPWEPLLQQERAPLKAFLDGQLAIL